MFNLTFHLYSQLFNEIVCLVKCYHRSDINFQMAPASSSLDKNSGNTIHLGKFIILDLICEDH